MSDEGPGGGFAGGFGEYEEERRRSFRTTLLVAIPIGLVIILVAAYLLLRNSGDNGPKDAEKLNANGSSTTTIVPSSVVPLETTSSLASTTSSITVVGSTSSSVAATTTTTTVATTTTTKLVTTTTVKATTTTQGFAPTNAVGRVSLGNATKAAGSDCDAGNQPAAFTSHGQIFVLDGVTSELIATGLLGTCDSTSVPKGDGYFPTYAFNVQVPGRASYKLRVGDPPNKVGGHGWVSPTFNRDQILKVDEVACDGDGDKGGSGTKECT